MHPKDEDTYPEGTVVRWKRTGQFAIIKKVFFRKENKCFSHYEGPIEGKPPGNYCLLHSDLEIESLPPGVEMRDAWKRGY